MSIFMNASRVEINSTTRKSDSNILIITVLNQSQLPCLNVYYVLSETQHEYKEILSKAWNIVINIFSLH